MKINFIPHREHSVLSPQQSITWCCVHHDQCLVTVRITHVSILGGYG